MPRTISLTVPVETRRDLLDDLDGLDVVALRVHEGASVKPPGDVIVLEVGNDLLSDVMQVADRHGLGRSGGVSMSTSEPLSIITDAGASRTREAGTTTWEELDLAIGSDSTMTSEKVLVMAIAGVIAGIGIISDAIHIVVGAMVIAPGFQPFARLMLGVVNRSRQSFVGGVADVGRAYAALLVGATAAAALGRLFGASALDAGLPSYLDGGVLVDYWTTITWTGVAVGAVAGVCGGMLISINRTVLTAGVMVALALVPTAALVPMALAAGDLGMSAMALQRFGIEVALVLAGAGLVFEIKRRIDHRRSVD
jgi:hypothetical protein